MKNVQKNIKNGTVLPLMYRKEAYGEKKAVFTDKLSIDGELMTKLTLHPLLEEAGVKSYVSHQIRSINENSVTVYDMIGEKEFDIEADTVVNALGKKPLADLEEPLRAQFGQYYAIGDARGRSNICTGIEQGFITALKI